MKLLTATAATQGDRDNDFGFTIEGELVQIGFVCATDRRNPDGGCGCGRAFSGLSSHRATTTAIVRDLDLSPNDLRMALAGYYAACHFHPTSDELQDEIAVLLRAGSRWDPGTVIERRLDHLRPRTSVRP